jgi:polyhydroxyalkanoate synthesis regulator phasin
MSDDGVFDDHHGFVDYECSKEHKIESEKKRYEISQEIVNQLSQVRCTITEKIEQQTKIIDDLTQKGDDLYAAKEELSRLKNRFIKIDNEIVENELNMSYAKSNLKDLGEVIN